MKTAMNTKTPIRARMSTKTLKPFVHGACVALLGFSVTASAHDLHLASELAQGNATFSSGNFAVTEQHGNRQDSSILQSGINNDSLVMQEGVGNRALSVQRGSGHSARILQSGGYLEGSIVQYGQGHEANLLQQGYGKEANIIQGGVRGRVDVMQLNASRGTPVEVTQFSRGKAAIQVIQH